MSNHRFGGLKTRFDTRPREGSQRVAYETVGRICRGRGVVVIDCVGSSGRQTLDNTAARARGNRAENNKTAPQKAPRPTIEAWCHVHELEALVIILENRTL